LGGAYTSGHACTLINLFSAILFVLRVAVVQMCHYCTLAVTITVVLGKCHNCPSKDKG